MPEDSIKKKLFNLLKIMQTIDECFLDDWISKTLCSYFKMFGCNSFY